MRKNYNNNDRVMFKIDVKIGSRILTLNVCEGDTIAGLLIKNNIASQSDPQRLNEMKDKIVINIQKQIQIKLYSNQLDLAKRMETFLNKQIGKVQNPKIKQKEYQVVSEKEKQVKQQTPFKMLFQRTQTFSNMNHPTNLSLSKSAQNSQSKVQNFSGNSSFAQSRQSTTGPINQINHLNPKHHNISQSNKKNQSARGSQSNQKASRRKVDEDLIKAYEIILKKSKDKAMRQMAERTLKELNVNVHDGDSIKTQEFEIPSQGDDKGVKQKPDLPVTKLNEAAEKQNIAKKPSTIEQFTQCREQMRKNTKYSYLESAINLTHEYEKENVKEDKKQYSYMGCLELKDETLKKPYHVIKGLDEVKNNKFSHGAHGVRRYNYLFD